MPATSSLDDAMLHGNGFGVAPASWYYLASLAELARKPRKLDLPDGEVFVGFCGANGRPAVLGARCSHMGADLSHGCVKGGRLACPLHGWEYGAGGVCEHIPSSAEIPAFARQGTFPVEVRGGHVFFFNRPEARFPMPFFDGIAPEDLRPARPFELREDAPWYMVAGNGFDRQHFENTHDRRLVAEPVVDSPHPFARRSQLDLAIDGHSYGDRLTRLLAGEQSRMTVTSWCGSLIFATATFRKVRTYGLVAVHPLKNWTTRARIIVWVRRSGNPFGRAVLDPVNAVIRRHFIRLFFEDDIGRLTGTRYRPDRMIPSDQMLTDYLTWLQAIHR